MSNWIFPAPAGLDIKVKRTPVWSTEVLTAESGKEQRAGWWSGPRYRFSLSINFLRQDRNSDELATIEGFFHRHRGQFDSFLFTDPKDSSVVDHGFGAGDGTTVAFQLQRTTSGPVTDILGLWPAYTKPRTNLVLRSQEFDSTAWIKNGGGTGSAPTVSPNSAVAPDGTLTADTVTFNTGAGTAIADLSTMSGIVSVTGGAPYTGSIYVKGAAGTKLVIRGVGGSAYALITCTGDWQRAITAETALSATQSIEIGIRQGLGGGIGTIPASATVALWGAQVEAGSTATRYIPTTSASATATPAYWPAGGDGFEPVTEPAPGPVIYKDGVALAPGTDYTISSSGLVTFAAAPAAGAALSWTGSYFCRVRFEQDEADFEREFSRVWGAKTIKLVSVK